MELISHCLSPGIKLIGIRSLVGFGSLVGPLVHLVLYLRQIIIQGHTSICFEENQLFLSLFSLSLLSTIHPKNFQLPPVRTSTECYFRFILIMGRSLKFRVCFMRLNRPFKTRFRFGFPSRG